jgi:putative DNA methylase
MAVFSRYSRVLESDGSPMRVRTALQLINQALDEVLTAQEGEYDTDTRWAIAWYEENAHNEGPFGRAETLSKAKNTSVAGMVAAGFLQSRGGKVRLLRRDELAADWNPRTDPRLTLWEVTQHLIHALDREGEAGAARLLAAVGGDYGERARDLAYRLYTTGERKGWAAEALAYNSLVVAWPAILQQAQAQPATLAQGTLFGG